MSSSNGDSGDVSGALDAYETAPAIMLACEGDDMVLASANEAARVAFGDRCEFGKPVREMAPEVDKRTIELMDDMVDTVYATGRSITQPGHRVSVRDEHREPFEVFWDLTVSPWYADDGSLRGVLAHGVDVTETTRAGREAADARYDLVAMQDAMMPPWLPVLPKVEIAGRYLLAQSESHAGGDWYGALGLPDGRVALIVGDVAGHGVSASAAMGRLRSVVEERLTSGADLVETMRSLDSFARSVSDASAATVCVVVLDTANGRLEYCTAGHPPPLVIRPEARRARFLPHTGAAPLATTGQMTVAQDHVDCGDLVLLYTDGILSRPGRSPAASTVELGQVATDAAVVPGGVPIAGPADRVCEQALDLITRTTGYSDDIAILVAEVTEAAPPLHLDLAADDTAVVRVLDALAVWLESMRVRDLDHVVVQHAVDELVTNIVEHAYSSSSPGGRLTVDAELLQSGELEIRFADTGEWVPPRAGSGRGRGLTIVRGMVDRLVLEGASDGTVATIRHRLSRPAHMLTGASTGGSRGATAEEASTLTPGAGGVSLAGTMDPVGVDELRDALVELADLDRVVIDLEGVTRLPSSAVQALHVACRDAADRGQDLVLHAPAGTTAQHVLELVRLPYVLRP